MDHEKMVYDVLDLPDVKITPIDVNQKEVHISVESSHDPQCFHCDSDEVEIKDIVHRGNIRDRNMMHKLCFPHINFSRAQVSEVQA